jgi:hypothetical protein
MDKTTKEWFESIEDPNVRERALANMNPDEANRSRNSLYGALLYGMENYDKNYDEELYWSIIRFKAYKEGNIPVGDYPLNEEVKEELIKQMLQKFGETNNTSSLDTYAKGLTDMHEVMLKQYKETDNGRIEIKSNDHEEKFP